MLTIPGIWLEGSFAQAFSLIYGYDMSVIIPAFAEAGIELERVRTAVRTARVGPKPIDRLNLWSIPVQDAVDLAVFLANVQIEMDRFLPGMPACGGPVDVMVLQMAPEPRILSYPGKLLHHPTSGLRLAE